MDDLLSSGLLEKIQAIPKKHRVLKSTKLEELVYRDVRSNSPELDTL